MVKIKPKSRMPVSQQTAEKFLIEIGSTEYHRVEFMLTPRAASHRENRECRKIRPVYLQRRGSCIASDCKHQSACDSNGQ